MIPYAEVAMGALGWTPDAFWAATVWDFRRALAGWKRCNAVEERERRTAQRGSELSDIRRWMAEEIENERQRGLR